MAGAFENFELTYKDRSHPHGLSNDAQAVAILDRARALVGTGYPGVAITYSANEGQTIALEKAYAAGKYEAGISGANQAQVMHAMESHLGADYTDLQMKAQIAPITTIPFAGTDPVTIVTQDIARIGKQLEAGWVILGWQNQKTVGNPGHPYAIGGGVAGHLPPAVDAVIQNGLIGFAKKYPAPS